MAAREPDPPLSDDALSRGIAAYRRTAAAAPPPRPIEWSIGKPRKPASPAAPADASAAGAEGLRKSQAAAAPRVSRLRRVAEFLVLVGGDRAAEILSRLDPAEVEAISREIAGLGTISHAEGTAALAEFRGLLALPGAYTGSRAGGVETARRILHSAFGPEEGERLLVKAVPEAARNAFDFLEDFSGEQIAMLFRDETPAAQALVLSRLPAALCAAALSATRAEWKAEIVRRIARMGETSPAVVERVAGALREKARRLSRQSSVTIDGMGTLAAILRHSDATFGDRLLGELEDEEPELSRGLQERLYTLDDVVQAEDRPIQEKLRTMSDRDVALLIKGRPDAFTRKILGNLSSARERRVREEGEYMGQVPRIEAEAAAREFMAWFRMVREEGGIMLSSDDDVVE